MGRFVPFAAVAGANCVNLPFMRWNEIRDGIAVFDKDGKRVGGKETKESFHYRSFSCQIRIIGSREESYCTSGSLSYWYGCSR